MGEKTRQGVHITDVLKTMRFRSCKCIYIYMYTVILCIFDAINNATKRDSGAPGSGRVVAYIIYIYIYFVMIVALRSVKKHFVFRLRVVRVNASALALARQDSLWTKLHGRLHRPPTSKSGTLSKRETWMAQGRLRG